MLSNELRQQTAAQRIAPLKVSHAKDSLLVHEIYTSVQGESTFAGVPCTFVRTTGCHLRCTYCDTAHAFFDGTRMPVDAVVAQVAALQIPLVELTGGEPLLQPASFELLNKL